MEFTTALFYVFAAILVLAATQVITARNPVHAALFLVLSFFSAAAIWLLLKAEFLAIVLVLVYVGAVMVLFLFVVMMLDIDIDKLRAGFWGHLPLAATVGVVIVLEMSAVLWRGFLRPDNHVPAAADTIGNTKNLGIEIFTRYTLAFEIAAAILLLAIVAAVALTLRRRKDSKYFDPAKAVKVKSTDRVRIVKMKAESERTLTSSTEKQEG
ncbi:MULTISPECIES: NADH-quinone oxidoreductase subunit J [unclassified Undibacterium]|jgi:NADH-quinone oxidoreductase subunit J|uniref:NADH-quinone oxidoreductase subunit J n=1 Tax=unclassified Undibacterium TaxID=2630295 RepID=UPI00164CB527|nr:MULTISPECIES: NADH-quinone oxidoreductase subunit J [unclassified Undibacterium]MBC3878596.1 NADH-quinone oxidoreductase subunit J [Undibacterium sp. FT79W]MBC3929151.1 NADH-quinone oxidoreductase subunit J [Undibacterium sp. CY21W]MBK1890554.1 NADH-quinone oxidoreductase subunit J [Undibacterium sp. 14-3-2]MBY0571126.1 NADH-quinone oxidoreductase subunit J [Burkholderiaceae bacterium]